MFCPECGTKNDDSALFCENCGAKMNVESEEKAVEVNNNVAENNATNNQQAQSGVTTDAGAPVAPVVPVVGPNVIARKPLSKQTKMILIGAAILVVAIFVFVSVGKSTTNPEKIASKYFEDVAAGNWEEVYEYYELSENDFVNKEMYKRAVKNKDKIEYSNYAVKQSSIENIEEIVEEATEGENSKSKKNDDLYKTIYIQYVGKNSESTNSTYVVKLFKTSKKKMLFFDNWKVVPEDMLTKNYMIRTLDGIEVTLDGKKLDKKYLTENESSSGYEESLKVYKIPSIFKGKHTLKFKGEYIDAYEEKVELTSTNTDSFSYTNPKIKESFIKELETSSKDIVNKLYLGAIADKEIDELELPYAINKEQEDDIEDRYESICEDVDKTSYASDISLKEFNIKEFKVTDDNSYIDSGSIAATISYRLTYKGKFVKEKGGKKENKTDEDTITGTITYKYVDGKWQITRMYSSDIYYYWY